MTAEETLKALKEWLASEYYQARMKQKRCFKAGDEIGKASFEMRAVTTNEVLNFLDATPSTPEEP